MDVTSSEQKECYAKTVHQNGDLTDYFVGKSRKQPLNFSPEQRSCVRGDSEKTVWPQKRKKGKPEIRAEKKYQNL